jgi:hypothetical protein
MKQRISHIPQIFKYKRTVFSRVENVFHAVQLKAALHFVKHLFSTSDSVLNLNLNVNTEFRVITTLGLSKLKILSSFCRGRLVLAALLLFRLFHIC